MVEVFKKGSRGEVIAFGEILKDGPNDFEIHSTDIVFTKTEFDYENKL